jgi:hypothetical protein
MNYRALWLTLALAAITPANAGVMDRSDCTPTYDDGEGLYSGTLHVRILENKPASFPMGWKEDLKSPQGTAALTIHSFDSKKSGSGESVAVIHTRRGRDVFISFDPTISVSGQWLNEDLVFIRAWWGRIAASEMVFDVHRKVFLYRKLANYGYLQNPECDEFTE